MQPLRVNDGQAVVHLSLQQLDLRHPGIELGSERFMSPFTGSTSILHNR